MAKRRETQVAGRPSTEPIGKIATPDEKGLWFLVLRHLERNHISYFPLNHHLVVGARVPDKVPSMGGVKNGTNGDNMIPTDKSGMINLAGCSPEEVWDLIANGTVRPVRPSRRLARLLEEGRRKSSTATVQLVPPMKRIVNLRQQYEQATAVELTGSGRANLDFAQRNLPSPF